MLELITLGAALARRDGEELGRLTTHRQKYALLTYLALESPVPRDRLLAVFWGERPEERARHSLSQALYALKRELGEECLQVSGDQIALRSGAVRVDAQGFRAAVEAGEWDRALELYRGPFLDGFYLPDTPEFEDWQARMRARLARLARRAFSRVIESRAERDDLPAALSAAWRWAELEPTEDEAQHALITLLARAGNRSAALKQYESYRERLERELGVEPLEATQRLIERIRAGEVPRYRSVDETRSAGAKTGPPGVSPERAGTADVATDAPPGGEEPAPSPVSGAPGPSIGDDTASPRSPWRRLLNELRARRVFHVGVLYLGFGWVAVEVADVLIDRGVVPEWVFPVLLFFLAAGLPFALILAWSQEQQRVGAGTHEAAGIDWPDWMDRIRGGHVLAVLGIAVLVLLVSLTVLRRGTAEPPIEAGATSSPARIGVLYFEDVSPNAEFQFIADGLTRELTDRLVGVPTLEVLPASALETYRDRPAPMDSIVARFGLGTIVHGSVMGSGDRIRVSVQLIDAPSLVTLASATIEESGGDYLELLDDLSERVARMLRQRIGAEVRTRRWRAGTASPEAWQLVQRAERLRHEARLLWETGDTTGTARALADADSALARARTRDRNWTEPLVLRAWVGIDRGVLLGPAYGEYRRAELRSALEHAERALALAPEDPAALEARGVSRFYLSRATRNGPSDTIGAAAERDLRAAVREDSTRARALATLSRILQDEGRLEEALMMAERAYVADAYLDEARRVLWRLCRIYFERREFTEAHRWCEEGTRRFPDDAGFIEIELNLGATSLGPPPDIERAWALYEAWLRNQAPQRRARTAPLGLLYVAAVAARAGESDSALSLVERARSAGDDPMLDYLEANVRLQLGEPDRAIALLASFLEAEPAQREYVVRQDWWWRELRDDPRFQALADGRSPP